MTPGHHTAQEICFEGTTSITVPHTLDKSRALCLGMSLPNVLFMNPLDTLLRDEMGAETMPLQAGEVAYGATRARRPALVILDVDSEAPVPAWQLVDLILLDPATASTRCSNHFRGAASRRTAKLSRAEGVGWSERLAAGQLPCGWMKHTVTEPRVLCRSNSKDGGQWTSWATRCTLARARSAT